VTIEEHIADAAVDLSRCGVKDPKVIAAVLRVLVKS
jgi:hypothetical protein